MDKGINLPPYSPAYHTADIAPTDWTPPPTPNQQENLPTDLAEVLDGFVLEDEEDDVSEDEDVLEDEEDVLEDEGDDVSENEKAYLSDYEEDDVSENVSSSEMKEVEYTDGDTAALIRDVKEAIQNLNEPAGDPILEQKYLEGAETAVKYSKYLTYRERHLIYSYLKQASEGDMTASSSRAYYPVEVYTEYLSWYSRRGMSQEIAKRRFVGLMAVVKIKYEGKELQNNSNMIIS